MVFEPETGYAKSPEGRKDIARFVSGVEKRFAGSNKLAENVLQVRIDAHLQDVVQAEVDLLNEPEGHLLKYAVLPCRIELREGPVGMADSRGHRNQT